MESTPVSGKDGTEGSSQDNLLHAAKPLNEEGINISLLSKERVVVENEGGTSSSSGDSVPEVSSLNMEGLDDKNYFLSQLSKLLADPEFLEGEGAGRAERCGLRKPSHVRTVTSRTSHETIKPHVEAPMTNLSVPGRNVFIVRPRASSSQANTQVEGDEEIVEEEAVCKFCFDIFKEENTLKTVCKCKNALIHEECAANWLTMKGNNCDICGERIENFPVTLLKGLSSAQRIDRKKRNKQSLFSRLKSNKQS